MGRDQVAQPPPGLGEHQVTGSVPDRIVDGGEPVQVHEDRAGLVWRLGSLAVPGQHLLGPFLKIRAIRQAPQPLAEGPGGYLAPQPPPIPALPPPSPPPLPA